MTLHVKGWGIGQAWKSLLESLLKDGRYVSPRGQSTKEIMNVTFEVYEGLENILISKERDLNYRFMIAEWLWILAGLNDLNILAQYNSQMKQFSDDGLILSGAYGPRLMPQIPYIVNTLSKEDSRQAVATIWTPCPLDSKDVPCTISIQWLIREEGGLYCTVNMRSSDAWLGLPYDYFNFSQLTNVIASKMKCEVGSITMNLASSHLYQRDWSEAKRILRAGEISSILSPQIPYESDIPNIGQLTRLLNQELIPQTWLWGKYQEALKHSKSHALEVLNELANPLN